MKILKSAENAKKNRRYTRNVDEMTEMRFDMRQ